MSNEIKEKEEYEKYARDHRKELDAQEVRLGDVVTVLVGHFAGEKGVIVGMIACDKSDYAAPYYEIEMECDVPEEFRVRKTLVGQSHVIGGVEKRHLKIIGNRAPMQPSNEIKQGDKVRVSKVAPRIYTPDWVDAMFNLVLKVTEVEDDNAMVEFEKRTSYRTVLTAIPCKYLVKVDAEAKEATAPKIKVGDRVEELVSRRSGRVLGIEGDFVVVGIPYDKEKHYWHIDSVELIEPTEQTEAEKPTHTIKIPVEVELSDGYWAAYAADLAKEIVLKTVNSASDKRPSVIAEYATDVAKAVVEGLKRK